MVKMTLKVEVNDLHIQYQLKVSQDGCCKFGDSSPHLWRVITQTSQFSWNSGSKWPKWPWRSRSMTSTSNTSRKNPRIHAWCKFGYSSWNLWRVIVLTRQSLWTDRQTNRHRQRQYPFGLKSQVVKIINDGTHYYCSAQCRRKTSHTSDISDG